MAKQETNVPNPTQERIRQEPQGTARELRSAYARFRFAADPALIDACAYERNALQAKYDDLLRVLINSVLGFAAMWLLNLTSDVTGLSLGLNLFNALTIGVLGVPGFLLLLLLQWVLA